MYNMNPKCVQNAQVKKNEAKGKKRAGEMNFAAVLLY
jgi:hypothetical protein